MLLTLAFAAGVTDAVSYLSLGRVFTANMTGNTVLLGIAVIAADGARIARSACELGAFCLGVALATAAVGQRPRRGPAIVLGGEAVVLAAVAVGAGSRTPSAGTQLWLIALCGLAMGAQSGVVLATGPPGIATTYITGTVTRLVASLTGLRLRGGPRSRREGAGSAALIWASYLAAALAGAAADQAWQLQAAWIACAAAAAALTVL